MIIFESKAALAKAVRDAKAKGASVGFVPTMGALHEGHISLLQKALVKDTFSVCSIFVNPTQFNDQKDLQHYPRPLEKDIQLLSSSGCHALFIPPDEEMYPPEEKDEKKIPDFGFIEHTMEGEFRPGHFKGVKTIVAKLLRAVQPDHVYFGEKDFQQLVVVKKLVNYLRIPVQVVECPTLREPDGLAMSSRNTRLSDMLRREAAMIPQALFSAQRFIYKLSIPEVRQYVLDCLSKSGHIKAEYFEIVDSETLVSLKDWSDAPVRRACIAAWAGPVRLIDNIPF